MPKRVRNVRRTRRRKMRKSRNIVDRQDFPPDGRGDIPRRPKRTFTTVSCGLPATTQQFTYRQLVDASTITASASANAAPTLTFLFSNIDNYTNAQALWDVYRIDAVRVAIIPLNTAIQVTTPATNSLVPLYCVIDYDNVTALTSAAVAKGYDNCIELQPGESCERTFQPRMAVGAYSGGGFGAYANLGPQWCDCANPSIQHYGMKIFVPQATASQTLLQQWAVEVEYFVSFRAVDN